MAGRLKRMRKKRERKRIAAERRRNRKAVREMATILLEGRGARCPMYPVTGHTVYHMGAQAGGVIKFAPLKDYAPTYYSSDLTPYVSQR